MLHDDDPEVRERAARAWCAWEDVHVATHPGHLPDPRYEDARFRLCFARLVTHYFGNAAFLADGQLLRDAHRLAGIPGVMIQGRLDISSPADVAWQLAQAWPEASSWSSAKPVTGPAIRRRWMPCWPRRLASHAAAEVGARRLRGDPSC